MKNTIILIGVIGMMAAMITSCGGDGLMTTPVSGFKYIAYNSNPGSKANPGDQVYFQMDILDDKDSILQSYRDQKVMPSLKMMELDDPSRRKNAIVDVLGVMAVGDSVDLLIPVDSIPNMPPGFDDMEFLK